METVTQKKYYLSWSSFFTMHDKLYHQVKASGYPFDVVVSIANGGFHIGSRLAEKMNLPHQSVKISRYGRSGSRKEPLIKNISYTHSRCPLVVDDLIDDGTTLSLFFRYFDLAKSAVLFYNPDGRVKPDFYVRYKPNMYVVFPWEGEILTCY